MFSEDSSKTSHLPPQPCKFLVILNSLPILRGRPRVTISFGCYLSFCIGSRATSRAVNFSLIDVCANPTSAPPLSNSSQVAAYVHIVPTHYCFEHSHATASIIIIISSSSRSSGISMIGLAPVTPIIGGIIKEAGPRNRHACDTAQAAERVVRSQLGAAKRSMAVTGTLAQSKCQS